MTTYPLGRKVNHDPRSWAYRVTGAAARQTVRWERWAPVFDQGRLGSCTGNAGTGTLATTPNSIPGLFNADEAYAIQLYSDATRLDGDPDNYPPTDTGSDGLSVAKVLKARGLVSGYLHAFGIDDAFTAIQQGPLMVGVEWTEGMFQPDAAGLVTATGRVAGGHEFECLGYDADTDRWEFINSWGPSWGVQGRFFMTTATFDGLLKRQGDIVLLTPTTQPAPTPAPIPVAAVDPADLQLLDAWAGTRHTGANARAAAAWGRVRGHVS